MPVWVTAVLGVATFVLGGLVSAVWLLAGINKDVERMKADIGTADSGMRQTVHKTSNFVTALQGELKAATERLTSLHEWKHKIGEAYLPRGMEDHERRLNKLEAKIFNGTHK